MHAHKMRLLRELTRLDTDYILLDLGAGTTYNTLDFFRVWNLGLVMTTPEYPSIINMMNFIKNVVLRIVVKGIGDNTFMTEVIEPVSKQSIDADVKPIPDIIDELGLINWERTDRIRQQLASLKLGMVVNRVKKVEDLQFVSNVQAALKRKLGVDVVWYGSLFDEPAAQLGWHAPKGVNDVPRLTGLARIAERIRQPGQVDYQTLIAEAEALQKHLQQV
jgi:flagellar biosynthesis protein FlhG